MSRTGRKGQNVFTFQQKASERTRTFIAGLSGIILMKPADLQRLKITFEFPLTVAGVFRCHGHIQYVLNAVRMI